MAIGFLAGSPPSEPKPKAAGALPLALEVDLTRQGFPGWTFTDPRAWRITGIERDRNALELFQSSRYEPPVRSPLNVGLIPGVYEGDFVLDLELRSTGRDYGHRDLCLIFGHRDPSHFYYAHLAKEADEHANSIFLVDGKPRVPIAETRTQGTPWDDGWHHARIVRKVGDGFIQVYFDDMDKPVMSAHDRSFTRGRIGVGSFDDTGMFRAIRVWGTPTKP